MLTALTSRAKTHLFKNSSLTNVYNNRKLIESATLIDKNASTNSSKGDKTPPATFNSFIVKGKHYARNIETLKLVLPRTFSSSIYTAVSIASIFLGNSASLASVSRLNKLSILLVKYNKSSDSIDLTEIERYFFSFITHRIVAFTMKELRPVLYSKLIREIETNITMNMFKMISHWQFDANDDKSSAIIAELLLEEIKAPSVFIRNFMERVVPIILDFKALCSKVTGLTRNESRVVELTTTAFYIMYTYLYNLRRAHYRDNAAAYRKKFLSEFVDCLQNYETINILSGYRDVQQRLLMFSTESFDADFKVETSLHKMNYIQKMILHTSLVAAVISRLSDRSIITPETVKSISKTILTYDQFSSSLNYLGTALRVFTSSLRSLRRLNDFMADSVEEEKKHQKELHINRGSIKFENISFSYPKSNKLTLKNINLSVPGKSRITIVGPSGAGKTTLIRLLLGLFSPTKGDVMICGQNLKDISNSSLYRQIAVIPQLPVLFNDTVRYNLLFGNEIYYTDKEILEKAESLGLLEIIQKAGGLDATVGEFGQKMSGGEKQCINVLRAALRKPKILVVDEGTAYCDAITSNLVISALDQLGRDCTVITVTHKLSQINSSDEVLVLSDGKIVQRGKYSTLLSKEGPLRDLYNASLQNLEKLDEAANRPVVANKEALFNKKSGCCSD